MPAVDLPEDGELQLGGVRLPAGRRIVAGYGSGAPVAWATAVPVADPGRIWQALSELSPETGLAPFLLAGLDEACARPWDNNEFSDPADISAVGELDAAELLGELWSGEFEDDDTDPGDDEDEDDDYGEDEEYDDEFQAMIAPFSRQFPGLAPAAAQRLNQAETDRVLGSLKPARIGVAAASRPADVLPLIGWDGAVNHGDDYAAVIAAILRSWEQRFGARLLRVGFAEIQLLAGRPPRTLEAARLLAAEQFAFCDECAGQGLHDVTSITDHLLSSPIWTFWWD
jgi:uncharacterized protein DUF4253